MLNFALDEMEHKVLLLFNRQFSTISLSVAKRRKANFRFEYILGLLMLFALYLRLIKLKCLVLCFFSLSPSEWFFGEEIKHKLDCFLDIKVTKTVCAIKENVYRWNWSVLVTDGVINFTTLHTAVELSYIVRLWLSF